MNKLYLYSGNCLLAECGKETNIKDFRGDDLHTGDIVALFSRNSEDEDERSVFHGFTAIVQDGYTTYTDGSIVFEGDLEPFVMGINKIEINNSKVWSIELAKKWSDVVDGEHWKSYGFNYKLKEELNIKKSTEPYHGGGKN